MLEKLCETYNDIIKKELIPECRNAMVAYWRHRRCVHNAYRNADKHLQFALDFLFDVRCLNGHVVLSSQAAITRYVRAAVGDHNIRVVGHRKLTIVPESIETAVVAAAQFAFNKVAKARLLKTAIVNRASDGRCDIRVHFDGATNVRTASLDRCDELIDDAVACSKLDNFMSADIAANSIVVQTLIAPDRVVEYYRDEQLRDVAVQQLRATAVKFLCQ